MMRREETMNSLSLKDLQSIPPHIQPTLTLLPSSTTQMRYRTLVPFVPTLSSWPR